MRWTVAALLRPITFALAIVAAVMTGNRTDSFWLGLLAFLIAMGAGRVLGAIIRGRPDRALYKAIWPGTAAGYAILFDDLGLPPWTNFFVSVIAATMTKSAVSGLFPKQRLWTRPVEWRRINLDELLP
jgi:hypothetical protein